MLPAHRRLFVSCASLSLFVASVAGAQEPATTTTAPAPGAEPAPAEAPLPPAWFRIDSDLGGLQLWAGATHSLTETIGLATDIYVNSGYLGEFDIGPAFTAGPFIITPMLGIQFDWQAKQAAAIVPQLYIVGGPDPIYTELWVQNYLYTPFKYPNDPDGFDNTLYFRFFVDYKLSKYIGIGPQIEPLLTLSGGGDTLTSLPIGGNVMLSNYGAGNTLFIYLGYETKDTAHGEDDEALTGRLTFVKNF
jgi:hypothetical protein